MQSKYNNFHGSPWLVWAPVFLASLSLSNLSAAGHCKPWLDRDCYRLEKCQTHYAYMCSIYTFVIPQDLHRLFEMKIVRLSTQS